MGPFDWIPEPLQQRALWVLTVLLLLLSLVLAPLSSPLTTEAAPYGIVSFELAGSADRAARIVDSWSPAARERAMLIQGLDYLYLFVYSAWLSLACTRIRRRHGGWFARIGSGLAWAVLAAGALDALENLALIQILMSGASEGWARLAWASAVPKFVLVLLAAAYLLLGIGALVWSRIRT